MHDEALINVKRRNTEEEEFNMAWWDKVMAAFDIPGDFREEDYAEEYVEGYDDQYGEEDAVDKKGFWKIKMEDRESRPFEPSKKKGSSARKESAPQRKGGSGGGEYPRETSKVVNMVGKSARTLSRLVFTTFEEAREVTEHLRMSRVVFVDLHMMHMDEAQRALDFLCGVCEGVNAEIEKASPVGNLFILTPNGYNVVTNDNNNRFGGKGVPPWN